MSENLDSIFRRLKKLLEMAADSSSPQEAANAAAMAENIMRKYQIDQQDVIAKELDDGKEESFGTADVGSRFNQAETKVRETEQCLSKLAVSIAKLNDAQAIIHIDSMFGKMIRFRGYKPDVEVCKFTFRYIMGFMQRAAKRCGDSSVDFKVGFTTAVLELLKEARLNKDMEAQAYSSSGGRSLVIVKKDAVGKHFGEIHYDKSTFRFSDPSAVNRGYSEGKKMDVLRRGVGHTAAPTRKAIQ